MDGSGYPEALTAERLPGEVRLLTILDIYDALTAEFTMAFHEVIGIPPENVYIKYEDITAWGVGGMYIDRRQFR